ncbi:MAG: hypothetical protein ABIQ27_09740, partial [Flavobacterium sp.]|uniref:hypothetical protein n=1 Tax=Flavobacterium sp. TaxID=239 RepID=UPI003267975B
TGILFPTCVTPGTLCASLNADIMIVQDLSFELFADYFQFYVQDESVDGNLSESWSPEASDRLLAVTHGTIGVGTIRNMDVPVFIKFFSIEPELFDTSLYDQINECDIEITSGTLVVAGCTDYFPDAARITTEPGGYRVRIYYRGFNTLRGNDLEGDDNYELHFWKTNQPTDIKILKQRQKASA